MRGSGDATAGASVGAFRDAGPEWVEDDRDFEGMPVSGRGFESVVVSVRIRAADHALPADEVARVRNADIAAAEGQLGTVLS